MLAKSLLYGFVAVLTLCIPCDVWASAGSGGGLPYETALKTLTDSITGPVAWGLSVIGVVGSCAALLFGGDMNGFMRTAVLIVLVACFICNAVNIIALFTGKGALIVTTSISTMTLRG